MFSLPEFTAVRQFISLNTECSVAAGCTRQSVAARPRLLTEDFQLMEVPARELVLDG
jgi:hypothetical protein